MKQKDIINIKENNQLKETIKELKYQMEEERAEKEELLK